MLMQIIVSNKSNNSTTCAGYYLSAQLWKHSAESRGQIATAVMEPTPSDGECLMFWYYMEGRAVGELNVYLKTSEGLEKLWARSGDQGANWRHGRVQLYHPNSTYQVVTRLLFHWHPAKPCVSHFLFYFESLL